MNYPPQDIETTGCPGCGSEQSSQTQFGQNPFKVVRCRSCTLMYLSPRLSATAMSRIYRNADYFDGGGYSDYDSQSHALRKTFHNLLQRLEKNSLTGGKLLEIGCAKGFFLREARPFFEETVATEYSAKAAEIARSHADKVHIGSIECIEPRAHFDLVVAFHVLEHIHSPKPFLAEVAKRLKSGGYALFAVPPYDSNWRKVLGKRWPSWKFPEHVVFYDSKTLPDLMQDAGFTELRRIPVVYRFPLHTILQKLSIPFPTHLQSISLPILGTTMAFLGKRNN